MHGYEYKNNLHLLSIDNDLKCLGFLYILFLACAAGKSGSPCADCLVGTFKPTSNDADCTSCGAARTTANNGSTTFTQCGESRGFY